MAPPSNWKDISAKKCAARDALIPTEWLLSPKLALSVEQGGPLNVLDIPARSGILTSEEIKITETGAVELVGGLATGALKSVDVVRAFCKRAAIAQQLTNCLTEIFFEAALERAAALDAYFAQHGKTTGPLHGLPVSMKDNFEIEGYDTTLGFIDWSFDPCGPVRGESDVVKIARQQGAVFFCKTNVPTAMMIAESYNNVWGYTTNPYNRLLSSGGSSGGEGSLLAMKGSPLGAGTDIGGSIRIPASFCGLYALKPSTQRFSICGSRTALNGQEAVPSVNGPMSTTLNALSLWSKAIVDTEWWKNDLKVVPIPWREITLPKKLCFGIIYDDGVVKPTPPILRGLAETEAALIAAGHQVIRYTPHNAQQGSDMLAEFFLADGADGIMNLLANGNEPWPIGLKPYEELSKSEVDPMTVPELWKLQAKRQAYVMAQLRKWNGVQTSTGRPMDGVIAPASPFAACLHHTYKYVGYTGIWNISDQTSAVFPVTNADPKVDLLDDSYVPRSQLEADIFSEYDAEKQIGGPVGLQIIGQRLEEEKVLAMVGVIDAALKAAKGGL